MKSAVFAAPYNVDVDKAKEESQMKQTELRSKRNMY